MGGSISEIPDLARGPAVFHDKAKRTQQGDLLIGNLRDGGRGGYS